MTFWIWIENYLVDIEPEWTNRYFDWFIVSRYCKEKLAPRVRELEARVQEGIPSDILRDIFKQGVNYKSNVMIDVAAEPDGFEYHMRFDN